MAIFRVFAIIFPYKNANYAIFPLKCSKLSRYSIFFNSDRRFVIFSTSKWILTTFEIFLFLEIFHKKTWKKFSKVFKFFWFLVIFRHILVRKHFDPSYFWPQKNVQKNHENRSTALNMALNELKMGASNFSQLSCQKKRV